MTKHKRKQWLTILSHIRNERDREAIKGIISGRIKFDDKPRCGQSGCGKCLIKFNDRYGSLPKCVKENIKFDWSKEELTIAIPDLFYHRSRLIDK